jgi:serine protease Do
MKNSVPFISRALALITTGLLLSSSLHAADWWPYGKKTEESKAPIVVNDTPLNRDSKAVFSFAPLVKQVAPSVVNISFSRTVLQSSDQGANPLLNDPFFRRFFNQPDDGEDNGGGNTQPNQRPRSPLRKEGGVGSGVIITKDGYILTNNHVVEAADIKGAGKDDKNKATITVFIPGNKKEYPAKIIGRDPRTEVALIKIEANDLTPITLGDSDKAEIGDMILAIGNPQGLGQSVSSGIISALGRSIPLPGLVDYQDFIQTDAAINPGNSGGALIDMEGRLIGLNVAIASRSGGSEGIGFAVPINTAKFVVEQLLKNGKIIRGYLGLRLQDIDSDLAAELKLGNVSGAVITDIESDGPSAKSDLKARDVIIEYLGKKVEDVQSLRLAVSKTSPGTKVSMKVLRDGKEKTVEVTIKEAPEPKSLATKTTPDRDDSKEVLVGVNVNDLTDQTRKQFNVPKDVKGAIIIDVDGSSPAADAGLREGDVIQEIGRLPVTNAEDCVKVSKQFTGDRVLVRVWSSGGSRYVLVKRK